MVTTAAGKSGLKLPVVCPDSNNFGDTSVWKYVNVLTAFDNGITHFDLANNYGPAYGSAERTSSTKLFGKELHPYRDEMLIQHKRPDLICGKDLMAIGEATSTLLQARTRVLATWTWLCRYLLSSQNGSWDTMRRLWVLLTLSFGGKALYVGLSNYDGPT